jgi:hypothetical protein
MIQQQEQQQKGKPQQQQQQQQSSDSVAHEGVQPLAAAATSGGPGANGSESVEFHPALTLDKVR